MSCDSPIGFPNATLMEQLATNNTVVWEEICAIQQAILAASSQCQPSGPKMYATIGGTTPMTFVSGITSVTVVNGGSGYFQDSPIMKFIPPIGSAAVGATGTITTNGGNIIQVDIVSGSVGYQPIPSTLSVSSLAGTLAVLQPMVDASGHIVSVNIVTPGTGYTTADIVTPLRAVAPNPAYIDAVFQITSVGFAGEILSVAVLTSGSGYQPSVTTIEIVSSLNPLLPYPIGVGFVADVLTDIAGTITQVIINNTGAGYSTHSPYLIITDPGTGATTSTTLGTGLTATSVASISVITSGSNYTQLATGNVLNPSTATAPNPPASPAVVLINVGNNTFGTNPYLYWQVWSGAATDKAIQLQLNTVQSYFTSLGYTVQIHSNPLSSNTIQWDLFW